MVAISASVVTVVSRLLGPVVNDLYVNAKGQVKKGLLKWSVQSGVKGMARALLKVESVKTIWSPEKEILLSDFYYPSKIMSLEAGKVIRGIESIDVLPSGNVIIQGSVGQGKSILMRHLASSAMRDETSAMIPIFLEFRSITNKRTLMQAVQKFLESVGVVYSEETFAYLAESGRLVFLLDGFDELAEECVVDTINEIEYMQVRFPNTKIIVSSRPKNDIQKIGGFSRVDLMSLNSSDYDSFLKRLHLTSAKRVELIAAIDDSPSHISGIIQTPLMLTLVVMVYQSERIIPPTLAEFFESLFQVVFSKHDRLKAGFYRKHHSGLSERNLQKLFDVFCFMVIQNGFGRTLKDSEFNTVFDHSLEYAEECHCSVENFKKDIVKVACLMLEEGLDLNTFLHRSILDFHASAFIKNSPADVAKLFYDSVSDTGYKRWKSVLSFLESTDSYRYSRDYVLPRLPAILKGLDDLLLSRSDSELLDFLKSLHPGFTIAYSNEFVLISFGPMSDENSIWDDVVKSAMFDAITDDDRIESVRPILEELFEGKELLKEITFKLEEHFEIFGADSFWDVLADSSTELHEVLNKARLAVDAQDKKKLIFERKPKKAD